VLQQSKNVTLVFFSINHNHHNEHTNKQTHTQTHVITIPPGRGTKISET